MKKIITLLLVFALACGCFAGCGDDPKEGGGAKALTFTDVSNTMKKMSEGAAFEFGLCVNVKPVIDGEYFTKEEFEATYGLFAEAKADGTYDFIFQLKGEAGPDCGRADILLKGKSVTDLVIQNETCYINVKSLFDFYVDFMKAALGEAFSAYADFLKWPYENEYIDLLQCMEFFNDAFGGSAFDPGLSLPNVGDSMRTELDPETVQAILSALSESFTDAKALAFLNKLEQALAQADALAANSEKIEFKLDKTNIEAVVLGVSSVLRTDLADVAETVAASLQTVEGLPEEVRELLSRFDKEVLRENLEEALTEEQINTTAKEAVQEFGDRHFYLTVGAKGASCSFQLDMLETGMAGDPSADVSQVGLKFEMKLAQKNISGISAPENVLTEAELQAVLTLLGIGGGEQGEAA